MTSQSGTRLSEADGEPASAPTAVPPRVLLHTPWAGGLPNHFVRLVAGLGKIGFAVMAAPESNESEVLAQELESLGHKLHDVEARLVEVEGVIKGLEKAALSTARALEEVSSHWDSVYRAMRRSE